VQPPSSPLVQGEPLYEAFYGFREQPFALSTDPRFLFLSGSHRRAYDELLTGLRRREGLLLLTGETGTGKTTLCRAVIDTLGHRTFSALILNPYMSDAEVLRVILRDFGLVSRDEIRRGALAKADMPQLIDTLEGFLRSLLPLQSYAVVIVDEAQSLAPVVLDQIRMLGSLEQDGQRLLQIMLVGQPALADTVKSESLRALNERITRRAILLPLAPGEVDEYIRHRMAIAGGRDAVAFEPEAIALVAELSRGLPRRVNLLCDRALEEGRVAGTSRIDAAMVRRAARAIAGGSDPAPPPLASIPAAPLAEFAELDLVEPAPETNTDRPLTFGQEAESPRRGRALLIVGAVLLLLAGAIGGGGYAWTVASQPMTLPTLPPQPTLNRGEPPIVMTIPTEEELRAALRAQSAAQRETPAPEAVPPPQD
jgi:type II secretory pathway predicted ATPase ExeA